MAERFPPTSDQIREARLYLAGTKERAEEISCFMSAGYGSDDQRAIRAQELVGAIQRLIWELERADANL